MSVRRALISVSVAAVALGAMATAARTEEFSTRYDMWLYGFPVGRAVFASHFEDGRFAITGRFRSSGLARIFEAIDGTVAARGRIGGDRMQPETFTLDYVSGEEEQRTVIRYSGDRARTAHNEPPLEHGKKWVDVVPKDLVGAADPLSALLIAAVTPQDVCNRTVKLYDGELRLDLVMQRAPRREHLDGGSVTCRVTFRPVSGFRPDHSTVRYLRDKARMTVAFSRIKGTGIYSPVEATVGTKIGTVWIKARQLDGR